MQPYIFTRKIQSTSDSEVTLKIHHSTRFCTKYKTAFFSLHCHRQFEISKGVFAFCLLCNKPYWNIFILAFIPILKTILSSNQKKKKNKSLSHKREKLNSNHQRGIKFYLNNQLKADVFKSIYVSKDMDQHLCRLFKDL